MPKHIPGYAYVRCQVPPDVAAVYEAVAARLDWNKPAVYMAGLCLLANQDGAEVIYGKIRSLLDQMERDRHASEFSDAADAADEETWRESHTEVRP